MTARTLLHKAVPAYSRALSLNIKDAYQRRGRAASSDHHMNSIWIKCGKYFCKGVGSVHDNSDNDKDRMETPGRSAFSRHDQKQVHASSAKKPSALTIHHTIT